MFNREPMSQEEARTREAQLLGLKVFGLLICGLALGVGIGWLLLI